MLKGIARADDAARAVEAGVDIIYVSNHGGRQLDHAKGCIDMLPDVVEAVDGRVPVIVDGGFLRGADVVKGLCLGATAVGTGRLLALGMAARGPRGVVRALELLETEIKLTMGLMGHRRHRRPLPGHGGTGLAPAGALRRHVRIPAAGGGVLRPWREGRLALPRALKGARIRTRSCEKR